MTAEALKAIILDEADTDMMPVHESSFVAVVHQKDGDKVVMMALRDSTTVADLRTILRRALNTWETPPAWAIAMADSLENLRVQKPPNF